MSNGRNLSAHSLTSVTDGRSLSLVVPQDHDLRVRVQPTGDSDPLSATSVACINEEGVSLLGSGPSGLKQDVTLSRQGLAFVPEDGSTDPTVISGDGKVKVEARGDGPDAFEISAPSGGVKISAGQDGVNIDADNGKVTIGASSSGVVVGSSVPDKHTEVITDIVLPMDRRVVWGDPENLVRGNFRMGPRLASDGVTYEFVMECYNGTEWTPVHVSFLEPSA